MYDRGDGAHTEGNATTATGAASHAEGSNAAASGIASHAEGNTTFAYGDASHAEGQSSAAYGNSAHAEGATNYAMGNNSHAEGYNTSAGNDSVACYIDNSGQSPMITGDYRSWFSNGDSVLITIGANNYIRTIGVVQYYVGVTGLIITAIPETAVYGTIINLSRGAYAHAEGENTTASGVAAHAEGSGCQTIADHAHAEGNTTLAVGTDTHAEGNTSQALGNMSHAEGFGCYSIGNFSHAEGSSSKTGYDPDSFTVDSGSTLITISGNAVSHFAYGNTVLITLATTSYLYRTVLGSPAYDYYSDTTTFDIDSSISDAIASGTIVDITLSQLSHAEGINTRTTGQASHAEGSSTTAFGNSSHAEGTSVLASGSSSHAEGSLTSASGSNSHAEGFSCDSSGDSSHSEGYNCRATYPGAHAEGQDTDASGQSSHAEGFNCTTYGTSSHVEGICAFATRPAQHAHAGGSFDIGIRGQAQNSKIEIRGIAALGGGSINLSDDDGNELSLEDGKAYEIEVRCVAIELDTSGGDALWIHDLLVRQEAGVITIRTDNTTLSVPGSTGWTFAVSVFSGPPDKLRFTFTTAIGTVNNVRVKATIRFGEISRLNY